MSSSADRDAFVGATSHGAIFHTTRWSVVIAAGRAGGAGASAALESLCASYWQPLYAYVRRRGHAPEEARDLTQGFFARLLEKRVVADADRERGRFRAFLLAALKHYLANEWDRARAERRGGAHHVISIDALDAESRMQLDPADRAGSPEDSFEREWALAVLARATARLAEEQSRAEKARVFEALAAHLTGADEVPAHGEVARALGISENAVKVALHRLRKRFGELVRDEVRATVGDARDVEDEIRALCAALER